MYDFLQISSIIYAEPRVGTEYSDYNKKEKDPDLAVINLFPRKDFN